MPDFTWNQNQSMRDNVINVIEGYLPAINFLSKKNHIADAKKLLTEINTTPKATDLEIYLCLQSLRDELRYEIGEYKRRLDFCVQQMENQNPLLSTLGKAGQSIKAIFGF